MVRQAALPLLGRCSFLLRAPVALNSVQQLANNCSLLQGFGGSQRKDKDPVRPQGGAPGLKRLPGMASGPLVLMAGSRARLLRASTLSFAAQHAAHMSTGCLETAARHEIYLKRALQLGAPYQTSLSHQQDFTAGPLIHNWRPTAEEAAGLLPELTHPVFADVLDFLSGDQELDQASIEAAAQLCCIGGDIHKNEWYLATAVRALLQRYLRDTGAVPIDQGFATATSSPHYLALGDVAEEPANLFLVLEVASGMGDDSGDAHYRGANYHLHFWRHRAGSSEAFRTSCCPAFLLEVVGPHVRLSSLAWLDRVTLFPLTPLLNLLPVHPASDRLVMPVARLLAALRMGLGKLAGAAAPAPPLPEYVARTQLPWPISMGSRYDALSAKPLARHTFCVRRKSSSGGGGDGGGEVVVVKLYRKYGLDAHKAWAAEGLAPKVLHEAGLPAGWRLLEMEDLPPPEWTRLSDLDGTDFEEAVAGALSALRRVHAATGMVHGDARSPNCLVRRDDGAGAWQVRFIDFEWAAREGAVTYPAFLNPEIPWPEGVGYGMPLRCAHDTALLEATAGLEERD
ncbi:hypothetical protein HYH03_006933 [Edaphochlamys debaryana]|uniref:Protein kinase domain-containing protein n=1 Tax=Edaphochlamys debaryana TaxID=47281 RepID=A0A835Y2Y0_9CHLO|nr:hypothetical protein HYH03_006933 [Edaphochlamys debaryana]|eukprot:KAG2495000.1 hypothetical protein HYH03_006933 [Edaphochlamys debaryana]